MKKIYKVLDENSLKTSDLSRLLFRFDADYFKFTADGKVFVDI